MNTEQVHQHTFFVSTLDDAAAAAATCQEGQTPSHNIDIVATRSTTVNASSSSSVNEQGAKRGTTVTGTAYVINENGMYDKDRNRVTKLSPHTVEVITNNATTWPNDNKLRHIVYHDDAVRYSKSELANVSFRNKPLLDNHNPNKRIGTILHGSVDSVSNEVLITAEITNPNLIHAIKCSQNLPTQKSFSIGYDVSTNNNWEVTSKTVNEVSLVNAPFFEGCHVRVFASKDIINNHNHDGVDVDVDDDHHNINSNINNNEDINRIYYDYNNNNSVINNTNFKGDNLNHPVQPPEAMNMEQQNTQQQQQQQQNGGNNSNTGNSNNNSNSNDQSQVTSPSVTSKDTSLEKKASDGKDTNNMDSNSNHDSDTSGSNSRLRKKDLIERLERELREKEELKMLVESRSADLELLDKQREQQAKLLLHKFIPKSSSAAGENGEVDEQSRLAERQMGDLFKEILTNPRWAATANALTKSLKNDGDVSGGFKSDKVELPKSNNNINNNAINNNNNNNNSSNYTPATNNSNNNNNGAMYYNNTQQQQYQQQQQQQQQQQNYKRSYDSYSNKSNYVPDFENGKFGGSIASQLLSGISDNHRKQQQQQQQQQQQYQQNQQQTKRNKSEYDHQLGQQQQRMGYHQQNVEEGFRNHNVMMNQPDANRVIHLTASASVVLGQALGTYSNSSADVAAKTLEGLPMVLPCDVAVKDEHVPFGDLSGWYHPVQHYTHMLCLDNAMRRANNDPHTLVVTASDEPTSFLSSLTEEQKSLMEDAKQMPYFQGKSDEALAILSIVGSKKKNIVLPMGNGNIGLSY